jgi:hypothetical protein
MPIALVVALITQVGLPLALKLIDLYQKDPTQTIPPDLWDQLKTHVVFSDVAGPK